MGCWMIIKGEYKYIKWLRFDDQAELYDIAAVPLEQNNLINRWSLVSVIEDFEKGIKRETIGSFRSFRMS